MKNRIIALLAFLLYMHSASAQIIDRVINRTKEKAKNKTEQKTEETIDKGLNKVEEGIGNIFKKKDKKGDTKANSPAGQNTSTADTDFSQYKGSSFIPGKNVLFFEDFATARVGAGNGNWYLSEYDALEEVEKPGIKTIALANGQWLKMPRKGIAFPHSFKKLPEQFTMEFDMYADPERMSEMESGLKVTFVAKEDREEYSVHWSTEPAISLDVHPHGNSALIHIEALMEYNANLSMDQMVLFSKTFETGWEKAKVNRVSISRNGKEVRLYLNGKEMLHLPNALPKQAAYQLLLATNMWGDGVFVSNIRIAGNVPNATNEIQTAGKFVTNAIYFDVNSSRIKPESWATLNNTAQAIKATSGNILIIGHTDSDGADEANLKLSKERAASVKNTLVNEFGIAATRLITDGKGEAQPISSNQTASGKAQNRRVEFIKQ